MKRLPLLILLMLPWYALSSHGEAIKCVATDRCPKDTKPPACCEPPTCEFFYELKIAKAYLRALSKDRQRFALALAGDDQDAGYTAYKTQLRKDMDDAYRTFAKCPKNRFYRRPPTLLPSSTRDCQIEGYIGGEVRPVTEDEVLAASNSCRELVRAAYAGASLKQLHCQRFAKKPREFELDRFVAELRSEQQVEVDSLTGVLELYWSACSVVADAATAKKVADAGIDALKPAAPKQPRKATRKG